MTKVALDVSSLQDRLKDNLFSRTLALREKEAVDQALGPVGTSKGPHEFHKTWESVDEGVLTVIYPIPSQGGPLPNGSGSASTLGLYAHAPPSVESVWTPDADYALVERLRQQIVGTDFNLSTFIGAEGKETLAFLGDAATRFNRAAGALRKGNLSSAMKVLGGYRGSSLGQRKGLRPPELDRSGRFGEPGGQLAYDRNKQLDVYRDLLDSARYSGDKRNLPWPKATANQVLEVQLALRPLIGDVQAAAGQLAWVTNTQTRMRYTGSIRRQVASPPGVWAVSVTAVRKSFVVYFTSTPKVINFLGLQDPEVTLWNALPLTFVFDYWYNVGGFLQARASAAAMPSGVYILGTKIERLLQAPVKLGGSTLLGVTKRSSGSFTRTISHTLPVPPPELKPLGAFESFGKTLNVVALAVANTSAKYLRL